MPSSRDAECPGLRTPGIASLGSGSPASSQLLQLQRDFVAGAHAAAGAVDDEA